LYTEPPVSPPGPAQVTEPDIVPAPPAQLPSATEVPVPPGVNPDDLHLPPGAVPVPGPGSGTVISPSSSSSARDGGPTVAFARYNPRTGEYMASDGRLYRQSDLSSTPKSWQELMPT
jgi:hypothetical protein